MYAFTPVIFMIFIWTGVSKITVYSSRLHIGYISESLFAELVLIVVDGMYSLLFCGWHVVSIFTLFVCAVLCDE